MADTQDLSFEATSRFARANDIQLHYNEAGEGDVLILLHGGGPGATGWSNFRQNLEELAKNFRVLIIDQPMFGLSAKPEIEGHFFDYSADAVRGLMDTLNIERAHFLGNSLGGGTSFRFALAYPERADRLIMMGPGGAAKSVTSPFPSDGLKKLLTFYDDKPIAPNPAKMRDLLETMVYNQSLITPSIVEERLKSAMDPEILATRANFLRSMVAHERAEVWRDIHKVKHQTLLTWGRDDRMLPLDGALLIIQQMENARLHVFPRCGHWAQLEHRHEFNRIVIDFLKNDLN